MYCNDDWWGMPRWFWYVLGGTSLVLFGLGALLLYLLVSHTPTAALG